MKKNYGIVTTDVSINDFNIELNKKNECKLCACGEENSTNALLVTDETSIYEYDYDCLKQKQKEL
ncbi:hypothetical protein [Clostridium sp. Marseille-P299]|uniref:hypothetical protein n=1 Tax=Clostridium sp. Marseille-P299 TaxID=1805477 RepID=UPI00082D36D9|nr:hypothetical protein [Clostridium sp. Marseille-P299]